MKKFTVLRTAPLILSGISRPPVDNEWAGESGGIVDVKYEDYTISWEGEPFLSDYAVVRKSEEERKALEFGYYKEQFINIKRQECRERIYDKYPIEFQFNMNSGMYDQTKVSKYNRWKIGNITAKNLIKEPVNAIPYSGDIEKDKELVKKIVPDWPVWVED